MSRPTTEAAATLLGWLREERDRWHEIADEDEQNSFMRLAAKSRRDQLDSVLERLPAALAEVEDEAVETYTGTLDRLMEELA